MSDRTPGVEVDEDAAGHRLDLLLDRLGALADALVRRRERPDQRGAELGLAGHGPAAPIEHVDELVGGGVTARRRLGDPGLEAAVHSVMAAARRWSFEEK